MEFTFTTTGIAVLLVAVGATICGLWFFRAFKKIGGLQSGRPLGILLSFFAFGLAFNQFLLVFGYFFLVNNPEAYYASFVISTFVLTLTTVLGTYLAFYLFAPTFSYWWLIALVFIYGIFVTIFMFITHPQPFLINGKSIDHGLSLMAGLFNYFLWLLFIIPPLVIFVKGYFRSVTKDTRNVSLFVILTTSFASMAVTIGFSGFLRHYDVLRAYLFDFTLAITGLLMIIGFFVVPFFKK